MKTIFVEKYPSRRGLRSSNLEREDHNTFDLLNQSLVVGQTSHRIAIARFAETLKALADYRQGQRQSKAMTLASLALSRLNYPNEALGCKPYQTFLKE